MCEKEATCCFSTLLHGGVRVWVWSCADHLMYRGFEEETENKAEEA